MLWHKLRNFLQPPPKTLVSKHLTPELIQLLEDSYPRNHNYSINHQKLFPHPRLLQRFKTITKYYPQPLTSLLDLTCSKGFFIFSASQQPQCTRALGIDLHPPYIQLCQKLQLELSSSNTQFIKMALHELAEQIDQYGGPFQTVLCINSYQYLFFGSDLVADCYLDHDLLFQHFRHVCSGRLIFNNRVEIKDCQNQQAIKRAGNAAKNYNAETLLNVADRYFKISMQSKLGRYPFWVFDAR